MVLEPLEQVDRIVEDGAECEAPDVDEATHRDRAVGVEDARGLAFETAYYQQRAPTVLPISQKPKPPRHWGRFIVNPDPLHPRETRSTS